MLLNYVSIVGFVALTTPNSLLLSRRIPNKLIIVGNINQKILQKIFFKMQIDLDKIKKLPPDVKRD